ncbi:MULTISPECIES: methylenetetrahydrofolate reductase [NAD(P)H] [unclassified Roseitalea]|uniref:methylenetetrahydrofolate reductase [NAD(P)H] n=1 Tax=unclassified Roseitalea TaxID=2639107 RepID=UPI00273F2C5A|nr:MULTISPECIES: methylenetetrahydrofolate reductase [NAD(P)H] [unclassified Roseitalea]
MAGSVFTRTQQVASSADFRVSFEFFPPKNEAMERTLADTIEKLAPLNADFVSVTYGAGGSTREPSQRTLAHVLEHGGTDAAAHITCVGSPREDVDAVIREFAAMGIRRFVALRGDPQTGMGTRYVPHPQGYETSAHLVAGLKAFGDFDVSVAAYPEKHPESPDFATDIDMLKRKVDNGADRAITQFFFDNDTYERYVERVRKAGIYVPIVPGILPIHRFKAVANFASKCSAQIPQWLAERFDGLDEDPKTHALIASAIAAEQVLDLVDRGVRDFHFYTMNRPDLVFAICRLIGVREQTPVGAAA